MILRSVKARNVLSQVEQRHSLTLPYLLELEFRVCRYLEAIRLNVSTCNSLDPNHHITCQNNKHIILTLYRSCLCCAPPTTQMGWLTGAWVLWAEHCTESWHGQVSCQYWSCHGPEIHSAPMDLVTGTPSPVSTLMSRRASVTYNISLGV